MHHIHMDIKSLFEIFLAERQMCKQEAAELRALRKKYKADKKAIKDKYQVAMTHH